MFNPDLVVTAVEAPYSAPPGAGIDVTVTVCNQGNDHASSSTTLLVLSTDTTIDALNDTYLHDFPTAFLSPGQCDTQSVTGFGPPVPDGAYYVGAIADAYANVIESDETNNTRASDVLGIGWAPDLVATAIDAPPSSADALPVTVTVCNRGTDPAGGVDVSLYLSTDTTIESMASNPMTPDVWLAGDFASNLYPGDCTDLPLNGWVGGFTDGAYYLGVVIDEWDTTFELVESNNTTVDGPIGIGFGPDLLTTAIDAPHATTGQFEATVTICNQGTDFTYGAEATIYVSEDQTIESPFTNPSSTDVPIGTVFASYLPPGQCQDITSTFYAPSGLDAPFLGALTDENDNLFELIETNNTFVGDRIGIGYGPDLLVEAIDHPPSADGSFEVTVRACNRGTDYANGFNVEVYASQDTTIEGAFMNPTSPDFPVAGAYFSSLSQGQCDEQTVPASSPGLFGPYFLGAIADEGQSVVELNEYNNVFVSGLMGFGYGSDLVVTSIAVPPSADGPFEVEVTLCNHGTAPVGTGYVELYLSTDTNITTGPSSPDYPIGGDAFNNLGPQQCQTRTIPTAGIGGFGPHYVGAVADPYNNEAELIESNNTTVSGVFGVGNGPELIVSAIDAPPSTDGMFSATVTVCNQGTAPSGGTDVEVILTLDDVIETYYSNPNTPDYPAGGASVPPMGPGQCLDIAVSGYAPAPSPAHYVAAIVDAYDSIPELVETNNGFVGDLMGIGYDADLVVTAIDAPPSANGNATVTVTACNQGTTPSSSFDVGLYVSQDATIEGYSPFGPPPVDDPIGSAYMNGLNPGACASQDVLVWFPSPQEAWYLGAVADEGMSVIELIETNNTFVGERIGLGYGPDLVVSAVTGPPSADGPFDVQVTVCNQGTAASNYTDVEIYASEDLTLTTYQQSPYSPDYPVAWASFNNLQPGACATQTAPGYPAPWTGPGYLVGIVDPYESETELNEDNNITFGDIIGFGAGPDFVVTAVSGPPSSTGSFSLAYTVCNQGTQPGSTDVTFYVSDDQTITMMGPYGGDQAIGWDSMSLAAGACHSGTLAVSAGGQGAYYLGAIVDEYNGTTELREDNNTFVGAQIGLGYDPDLVVTAIAGPPSTTGNFTIDFTACNQGTTPSSSTDVSFYLVTGDELVPSFNNPYADPPIAGEPLPSLAPGQCYTALVIASAYMPGAFRLGAIVDEYGSVSELIETNNGLLGGWIGVGYDADLVVESVSGPAVTGPGTLADFVVRVCNQGTIDSPGTSGTLYLSPDATITAQDSMLSPFPVNSLLQGQCEDVLVPAPMPGSEGQFFVGAIVDDFDYVTELIETNNASAGTPIELSTMYCGDGYVDPATEECDDGNGTSGDGCSATCFVEHTVWEENASGPVYGPYNWNYAMGFHFTPTRNGEITELGGYFYGGPKTIRLFERDTGVLLAETQVAGQAASGQFAYAAIASVPVAAGTRYTVAVYIAGNGGTYRRPSPNFPVAYGDVTIDGSTYAYTGSNPNARPTNNIPQIMYGQADIRYAPTE